MTQAPKLEEFGKDLLRRIQERKAGTAAPADAGTVEVHHTPAQGQGLGGRRDDELPGLPLARRPELAEKVAHIAESTCVAMSRKWFGEAGSVAGRGAATFTCIRRLQDYAHCPRPPS